LNPNKHINAIGAVGETVIGSEADGYPLFVMVIQQNNLYLRFRRLLRKKKERKTKKINKENCFASQPNEFLTDLNETEYELKLQ
jgi:hypothetical protein